VYVKTAARRFIEEYLHDDDLMAVVYTGRSNVGHSFTNDRRRLLADVDQFYGRKDQLILEIKRDSKITSDASRARRGGSVAHVVPADDALNAESGQIDAANTLVSVRGSAECMGDSMPGRHKAMVLFSEGLAGFRYDDTDSDTNGGINGNNMKARIAAEFRDATAAAARANVSIFTIDPRGGGSLLDQGDASHTNPISTDGDTEARTEPTACVGSRSRQAAWRRSTPTTSRRPSIASSATTARTTSWPTPRRSTRSPARTTHST
jgi:hypothetical protein